MFSLRLYCTAPTLFHSTQVLPIPKPRAIGMTESEIQVSERSVRRHAKKAAEEASKAEEKARKLVGKKMNDSKKSNKEDTEEKELIVEKIECFGEELVPDFSIGKEAKRKIT